MELIDREKLQATIRNMVEIPNEVRVKVLGAISRAKAVDAKPVVHGRWLRLDAHKGIEQFKCSICRIECYVPTCMNEPMYEYCPICGNPMDGGAED